MCESRIAFKKRSNKTTCTCAVTNINTEALPTCYNQPAWHCPSYHSSFDNIDMLTAALRRFPRLGMEVMDSVVLDDVCLSQRLNTLSQLPRTKQTSPGKVSVKLSVAVPRNPTSFIAQAQRERSLQCARGGRLSIGASRQ